MNELMKASTPIPPSDETNLHFYIYIHLFAILPSRSSETTYFNP